MTDETMPKIHRIHIQSGCHLNYRLYNRNIVLAMQTLFIGLPPHFGSHACLGQTTKCVLKRTLYESFQKGQKQVKSTDISDHTNQTSVLYAGCTIPHRVLA